jgi:hypothetical protein
LRVNSLWNLSEDKVQSHALKQNEVKSYTDFSVATGDTQWWLVPVLGAERITVSAVQGYDSDFRGFPHSPLEDYGNYFEIVQNRFL